MSNSKRILLEQRRIPNDIDPIYFQNNELNGNDGFISHFHGEIEILHVITGKITVYVYNEEYVVLEDQLCLIPSMFIHSVKNMGGKSTYDCCLISPAYYKNNGVDITRYSIQPIITSPNLVDDFVRLKKIYNDAQQPFRLQLLRNFSMCLIINLIQDCSVNDFASCDSNNKNIEIVKEITLFLKDNSNKQIDIDAICHKYGYSPSYLSRIFKKYTKTTMTKALNYYRCIDAQKLLMTQNISIMEVSELCGFNNYSYFTKTYKQFIGELPSKTHKKYFN